ncbi:hypothetical protein BGW41_005531 [Actinomortierella wolfii]|nr:hypothetical protein BGW41_005531 [Actinomortierella wolfii]
MEMPSSPGAAERGSGSNKATMSQSPLPKATTAFNVAFSIPARNRTCLASLPRRKLSTVRSRSTPASEDATNYAVNLSTMPRREPGRMGISGSSRPTTTSTTAATADAAGSAALKSTTSRIEGGQSGCLRTFFFSQQCLSRAAGYRSEPISVPIPTSLCHHHHHHHLSPQYRSFSTQPAVLIDWSHHKVHSAVTSRNSISQSPWAALDTAYQRRKSPTMSRTRVRRSALSSTTFACTSLSSNQRFSTSSTSSLAWSSNQPCCTGNSFRASMTTRQYQFTISAFSDTRPSARSIHSTSRARRSSGFNQLSEQPVTVHEKRLAISYLRQKIFHKASTLELWEAYSRMAPLQAMDLLRSEDVISMYEILMLSPRVQESMEMMLQVAFDLADMGKQLPPPALDMLLRQMVEQLPADQIKSTLTQVAGQRRFITNIVMACESNDEMIRVLELYRRLLKNMHDVDSASTYYRNRKDLAERLGKLLSSWIKTECVEHATPLNGRIQEYILTFMLDRGLYDDAYNSMLALSKKNGMQFSDGMYTTAIHRLGLAERFDYMDIILEHMKRQGIEPTINHYSALIDVYSKSGNLREAQKAYQEILAAGLTPTAATFGPMLEAVGRMGDYEMTKQLAEQMNASGVPSNAYTLNALLQATASDPAWSLQVFQEMTRDGTIEPNVANYNMLLRTFRLHGDLDGAFRVFRWWRTHDAHIRPNERTLSTLLSLFADRGEVEGGEALWDEMVRVYGVQPNAYAYASMIHLYCTAEDMASAHGVYREMIQVGIKPNIVVFGTLLNAYARYGDLTQMLSIYDVMRSEGLKPNSYIYTNLLLGLVQDGDMTAARRLYANMEEDGFGNNVLAQTILMRGYFQQGKRSEALKMYNHMVRSGQVPNYLTYATMIHAHVKQRELRSARALIDRLVHARELVELGDEHQALAAAMDNLASEEEEEEEDAEIRAHRWSGDRNSGDHQALSGTTAAAAKASSDHASMHDFHEDDLEDDDIYDDRMLGRAARGQLTETGTEGQQLKEYFKSSMLALYAPLLDAYAKEGDVLASEELFREMKARHLKPNTILYTMLMDSYRREGMVDNVLRIWKQLNEGYVDELRQDEDGHATKNNEHKLRKQEWKQDQVSTKPHRLRRLMQHPISIVIDSLSYSGRIDEAMKIWHDLEKEGVEFDSTNWNDYCIALARNGRLLQACHVMKQELLRGHLGISTSTGTNTALTNNGAVSPQDMSKEEYDKNGRRKTVERAGHRVNAGSATLVTLSYPRPRTFAALADALDQLLEGLLDYNTSSVSFIKESLRQSKVGVSPALSGSSSSANPSISPAFEEALATKLDTYPRPFERLDLSQRNMLWEAIRTQYPEVLRAVCEGSLVSRSGEAADASSSSTSTLTSSKKWQGFRPWRGVSSYLRDYDGQPKNSNQRYSRVADTTLRQSS